jgi:hypothetical protein
MEKFIRNMSSDRFEGKVYYVLFQPIRLLSFKKRRAIQSWASRNWAINPRIMHRLYWAAA